MLQKLLPATFLGLASCWAIADDTNQTFEQDFSGYRQHGWGLIAPVPYRYDDSTLSIEEKLAYTPNNRILFDVRWAERTLRDLLEWQWSDTLSVKEVRQAFNGPYSTCKAKLEVGKASIYGPYPYHMNVAELDSDLYHCGNYIKIKDSDNPYASPYGRWYQLDKRGNPSSVRVRTFIPTTPGVRYTFDLDYAKRIYGYDRTQDKLIVNVKSDQLETIKVNGQSLPEDNVDAHRIDLPLTRTQQNNGFNKATVEFVADRFFTPITVRANDKANSYGPLLNSLKVQPSDDQDLTDIHIELCESLYEPYSQNLKECLTNPEPDTNVLSCNVDEALQTVVYGKEEAPEGSRHAYVRINKEGVRTEADQTRYRPENMTGAEDSSTFYSVGRAGATTVKLNCPVQGKSLFVREFTGGGYNRTFADYPEQGVTKVQLKCLRNGEIESSWLAVADIGEYDELLPGYESNEQLLRTNRTLNVQFGKEYQGCRLTAIRFADKTHRVTMQDKHNLSESQLESHLLRSDGFEIQALGINTF